MAAPCVILPASHYSQPCDGQGWVRSGKREKRQECDSVIMSKIPHFKERQDPADSAEREATEMRREVRGPFCREAL